MDWFTIAGTVTIAVLSTLTVYWLTVAAWRCLVAISLILFAVVFTRPQQRRTVRHYYDHPDRYYDFVAGTWYSKDPH